MAKLSERIANAAQTVNDAWRVRLQAWAREVAELERQVAIPRGGRLMRKAIADLTIPEIERFLEALPDMLPRPMFRLGWEIVGPFGEHEHVTVETRPVAADDDAWTVQYPPLGDASETFFVEHGDRETAARKALLSMLEIIDWLHWDCTAFDVDAQEVTLPDRSPSPPDAPDAGE